MNLVHEVALVCLVQLAGLMCAGFHATHLISGRIECACTRLCVLCVGGCTKRTEQDIMVSSGFRLFSLFAGLFSLVRF